MSFGKWLLAAAAIVGTVAAVQMNDARFAMILAVVTLLAVAFHNRRAWAEITRMMGV